MKRQIITLLGKPGFRALKRLAFLLRGLVFAGTRYKCPCCNWTVRGFVGRSGLFQTNSDGYCPRCNAKARHRRMWRYLQTNTNLMSDELRFLEVAPWWSTARRFSSMPNLQFVGLDLDPRSAYVTIAGDVTAAPLQSGTIDAVLCMHVLEHVDDDQGAIDELFRVLKPGGWAVISVPLLLDEVTREDPAVTSPEDRERLFGERSHVRYYGTDFIERLQAAGFEIRFEAGRAVPADVRVRFGIRPDENIFHCMKPL